MKSNLIELHDVWMEDVFLWFIEHIGFSGGDGAAAIVCANYKEAAEYFLQWHVTHYQKVFHYAAKHEEDGLINFHDCIENVIFTNKVDTKLWRGDYVFIIRSDCPSMFNEHGVLKSI